MTEQEINLLSKLKTIGFKDFDVVIDAACGTGNWSYILSLLNKEVIGYDSLKNSILEAKKNFGNISNLKFINADLITSPIKNNKANLIVCADSLMFANPIVVLNSFYKELKENGLVYISVNGSGWILNCLFNRGMKNRDFSKINMGIKIIFDTLIRRLFYPKFAVTNTVYTINNLKRIASQTGFKVIHADYEGTYLNPSNKFYQPLFDKKFWGFSQSLEIVLKKQ